MLSRTSRAPEKSGFHWPVAESPAEAAVLSKPSLLRPEAAFSPRETADTVQLGAEVASSYAVVIDGQSQEILAEKGAQTVISPASMTKVLTLLVAAEQLEEADLDDTFTMTIEITDYCFVNGCSVVGLDIGETMIGMHMRPVAVPMRLAHRSIGEARANPSFSRPRLIGGVRARYTLEDADDFGKEE